MKAWKRTEPTKVTRVGYRIITSKTFKTPDGKVGTFDTLWPDGQEFACAIVLTAEYKVVIARQFRIGPEKIMDEIPGGAVEVGESPEQAVRREVLEETGYTLGEVTYLGAFYKDAYLNAIWHGFLATNCVKQSTTQTLDDGEYAEVDEISIAQLFDNALNGRMTDIDPIFRAQSILKRLQNG